ncbi:hypothetical protein B0H67DRAFT_99816 [Lasiosphaeris hirsuta]|uniref:Uncharacterized protein n=1 Tax=Lasiosphaeris hirsuta TaxID=260670 RepID=A0AA40AY19_9PEZI|nr:hypothetical protein B0H67DRAFT_99816 [Lasiosphaeris hirsuta]
MVGWCCFVRAGGLSLSPSSWGSRLRIHGWIFSLGPFLQLTAGKMLYHYIKVEAVGKVSGDNSNTVLQFFPDFGTAFPGKLLMGQFEAVSTYTERCRWRKYAIVFERENRVGKRIRVLDLTVVLEDRNISLAQPFRICNPARSFGAERGNIWLN